MFSSRSFTVCCLIFKTLSHFFLEGGFLFFLRIFFFFFLAALGLHCCARAFSICCKQGLLFVMVRRLLIAVASLVAEQGL